MPSLDREAPAFVRIHPIEGEFAAMVLGAALWVVESAQEGSGETLPATCAAASDDQALLWLCRVDEPGRKLLYALPRRLSPFTLSYLAHSREFRELLEGMRSGRRVRDDRFIRAAQGSVAHELQIRLMELETFGRCLPRQADTADDRTLAMVRNEIFALGEEEGQRVRSLASRAVRWQVASREECAFLLPGSLLNRRDGDAGQDGVLADRLLSLLDAPQRAQVTEAWANLGSLREARNELRESLIEAFHTMRSSTSTDLTPLFALGSTYSVLEARTALVQSKVYLRVASMLRLDQRRKLPELLAPSRQG